MKPSEVCKLAGLKSLKELSEITKVSPQTLINWNIYKPNLFDVVVAGAKHYKNIYESNELSS